MKYEDLTEEQKNQLSYAWLKICEGLEVYTEVTGVGQLDDMVNSFLWDTIELEQVWA